MSFDTRESRLHYPVHFDIKESVLLDSIVLFDSRESRLLYYPVHFDIKESGLLDFLVLFDTR